MEPSAAPGLALEYVILAWNVAGIVVLTIAAGTARSVALAWFGLDSLSRVSSAYVDTAMPSAYADGIEPVRDITEDAAGTDPDAGRAGWSWQQMAERLGVTRQTVHRQHGKRTGRPS